MAAATNTDLIARVRREALKATAAAGEAVGELRDKIADLKDQLRELDHFPCSRGEALERLRMATADYGRAASGKLTPLLSASPATPAEAINMTGWDLKQLSPVDLVAALLPDALTAWAIAALDRQAAALGGWSELDQAGRDGKRRSLAAEVLALERQEEDVILAAEEAGVTIRRRADADPRAVLGLDR